MRKNRLTRLEDRIERLVEGSFSRLFAGHLEPRQVAVQLARAMEDNARVYAGQKRPVAPDTYTVFIHPNDYAALTQAQPDLASALGAHLVDLASRSGMTMAHFPTVTLSPSVSVQRQMVRVVAEVSAAPTRTAVMDAGGDTPEASPLNARLIVEGDRAIPLTQAVINIGRRLDNTIVLDDARISRRHAQLRLRQGRYVLLDLGSRGGTAVNGAEIEECILQSGDRISFGGVPALYVEDTPDQLRRDTQIDRLPP